MSFSKAEPHLTMLMAEVDLFMMPPALFNLLQLYIELNTAWLYPSKIVQLLCIVLTNFSHMFCRMPMMRIDQDPYVFERFYQICPYAYRQCISNLLNFI